MAVVIQHPAANMTRNPHDRLFRSALLGQFGDRLMPQIVESKAVKRAFNAADIRPTPLVCADCLRLLNSAAVPA